MENSKEQDKQLYTLGIWEVKQGKETEFIKAWTEFANWTKENIHGCGKPYLLQDESDPLRFISYGPWDDEASIKSWRETNEFKDFASKVRDLCDVFQPNTLKVVSTTK